MPTTTQPETGIFEYTEPLTISTEEWANSHLDCDAIVDDNGGTIVVYAFTMEPKYNRALEGYKKKQKYANQYILKGVSSDALNSLF